MSLWRTPPSGRSEVGARAKRRPEPRPPETSAAGSVAVVVAAVTQEPEGQDPGDGAFGVGLHRHAFRFGCVRCGGPRRQVTIEALVEKLGGPSREPYLDPRRGREVVLMPRPRRSRRSAPERTVVVLGLDARPRAISGDGGNR